MKYQPTEFVTFEGVRFGRATEAYNENTFDRFLGEEKFHRYQGMPLFDGRPEHLDIYVKLLLHEVGRDGLIAVISDEPVFGRYEGGEYELPIALPFSVDVGVPGETQWPVNMGFSHSFNKELLKKAGEASGEEIRGKTEAATIDGMLRSNAYTAISDIRWIPLDGRFDEGFGEDAKVISDMSLLYADGMSGREHEDDLYYQVIPETKHWTSYHGEFFRNQNYSNVSVRSFYEQHAKTAKKAFESGAFLGYMSSYGAINGVPSTASFVQKYAQEVSKNGLMTICDAGSETGYVPATAEGWGFSNGFDAAYSNDFSDRAASMMLAGHHPGRGRGFGFTQSVRMSDKVKEALDNGILGLKEENLEAVATPFFYAAVRSGALDERDEGGIPCFTPFAKRAADGAAKRDHTSKEHQELALQAAREAIVLLKNDGTLPLQKGPAALFGPMAAVVQYGLYSSKLGDRESYSGTAEAGLSIREALEKRLGKDRVTYETGGKLFRLVSDGMVLAAGPDGSLHFEKDAADDSVFELTDWGQTAVSIRAEKTGKWLSTGAKNTMFERPDAEDEFDPKDFVPGPGAVMPAKKYPNCNRDLTVYAVGEADFRPKQEGFMASFSYPEFLERKTFPGGVGYKCGSKFNSVDFGTRSATPNLMGWYLRREEDRLKIDADPATSLSKALAAERDGMKNGQLFMEETIRKPGQAAAATVKDTDTALIVLGMPYNGINGEGTDRITINLADEQVEMAHEAARIYAEAGKKTVVIVHMDAPAALQSLEDDPNINAILTFPMSGQYEAEALMDILYGEVSPSGHLTATWYRSDQDLPAITKYTLPYGAKVQIPGEKEVHIVRDQEVNAKVDFTAVDIMQSRLGYQYFTKSVTYPFGYGLSYTKFEVTNIQAPAAVSSTEPFSVSAKVTNIGLRDGAEVLQLYLCPKTSAYGEFAPKKILASYEKIFLKAGESKEIRMTVDPETAAVYDVNAGKYLFESGDYELVISEDSAFSPERTFYRRGLKVQGESIAALPDKSDIVLWKRSFGAKDILYREYMKSHTAETLREDSSHWNEMFSCMSTAPGAFIALKNVCLDGAAQVSALVSTELENAEISLHLDQPEGREIARLSIERTGVNAYRRYAENSEYDAGLVHEPAYREFSGKILETSGTHDVYVVFHEADVRAFKIALE